MGVDIDSGFWLLLIYYDPYATSGSVAGEKYAPSVSKKLSKAATGKGKLASSLTKKAGLIIDSMGKYLGNALDVIFRVRDYVKQSKSTR